MKKAEMIEKFLNGMAKKQIKTRTIIDKEWKAWLTRQLKATVEQNAKNSELFKEVNTMSNDEYYFQQQRVPAGASQDAERIWMLGI